MKKLLSSLLVIFLILGTAHAQESEKQQFDPSQYRMRFNLNTIKQNDGSRLFEVKFLAQNKKNRKERIPVYKAKIDFFNVLGDEDHLLGSATTTDEGIAQLVFAENKSYLSSEDGTVTIKAVYTDQGLADQEEGGRVVAMPVRPLGRQIEAFADAIQPNTKVVFAETLGNPGIEVLDIEAVADVAHAHELPLMVDSTFSIAALSVSSSSSHLGSIPVSSRIRSTTSRKSC